MPTAMELSAAQNTAQDGDVREDHRGADDNVDTTTAPAGSGVGAGVSPLRTYAQAIVSPDPKTPLSQVSRFRSPRRARATSHRRRQPTANLAGTPPEDREDSKEQQSTQTSMSRSRRKQSAAARQRRKDSIKQQRPNVGTTSPAEGPLSPRSPQLQSVTSPESEGAMSPAPMTDGVFSTPPTAVALKDALSTPLSNTRSLSSPSRTIASPKRSDTSTVDAESSEAGGVNVNGATKSLVIRKRGTVRSHKSNGSRSTSPLRTTPAKTSNRDAIPEKDTGAMEPTSPEIPGETRLFLTPPSPTDPGQLRATLPSSAEYCSPLAPGQSSSDGASGELLVSPPITSQPDVAGPKPALRGVMKRKASRVSIRPCNGKREDDDASPTGLTAIKAGKRPSRASFKDEVYGEEGVTAGTTRSSFRSAASRRASGMSVRSFALDSSLPTMVPQERSVLFMGGAAFVAVLVTVLASIILLVITRSDPASEVACRSAKCIELMDELRGLVDSRVDPCRDFYGYVCNAWLQGGRSFFADNVNRSLAALATALAAAQRNAVADREGMGVLLQVHAACEEYVAGGGWSLEEVLNEADELLTLSAMTRASTLGEVVRLLLRTSMKTGLATVVETDMIRHQEEVLFYLSLGMSVMNRFSTFRRKREVFAVVVRVLHFFGYGKGAPAQAEAILQMDFAVSKIVDAVQDPPEARVSFPKALGDCMEAVSGQDWVDYVNEFLPPSRQLNGSEPVMTLGLPEIRSVLREISGRGVRMTALYLATYLTMHIAWVESSRSRVRADRLQTSSFCLNLTARVLTQSWPQLVSMLIPVPLDTTAVVATVFDYVRRALTGMSVLAWLNDEERSEVAQAIANTSLVARLPVEEGVDYSGFRLDDVNVSTAAANDTASPMKRFVAFYLRAMAYDRNALFQHPPTRAQTMMAQAGHAGPVRYVADIATVLVPGLYRMAPYSYSSAEGYVPEYFNHGTLGVLLSWEVAKITAEYGHGVARAGPALPEKSLVRRGHITGSGPGERYMDKLYCLVDLHAGLGFKHNASGSAQERHAELFRRALGMQLAYNALLESFRTASPDYDVFSTYWPQAQWAFFVRACLMMCTADQTPSPLTPRENCMLPLHNMDEFAGAFDCRTKPGFVKGRCHM